MAYERGTVVKGPDLFADYDHRPYVCLSDDTHPFGDEEALYLLQGENPALQGGRESDMVLTNRHRWLSRNPNT